MGDNQVRLKVRAGFRHDRKHDFVLAASDIRWNSEGGDFRANLEADADVTSLLSPEQLADCFSTDLHQANLGVIWERLGI